MYIMSVKLTRKRLLRILIVAVAVVGIAAVSITAKTLISSSDKPKFNYENTAASTTQSAATVQIDKAILKKVKTNEDRIKFLSWFGWQVQPTALEQVEVTIPEKFSPIYEKYNEIQLAQGLDLKKYTGKKVQRYTYLVTNYPGMDKNSVSQVYANIILYKDTVIGGDISSTDLNGFMHGFAPQQQAGTTAATADTLATTETVLP